MKNGRSQILCNASLSKLFLFELAMDPKQIFYRSFLRFMVSCVLLLTCASLSSAATVSISANDPNAAESRTSTGQFTVSLDTSNTSDTEVNFTVSGTATEGTDYNSINTSVTIPAGDTSATITIQPIDDDVVEGDETVIVTLTGTDQSDTVDSGADEATVTISDNDSYVVSIAASSGSSIAEDSSGSLSYTVSLDGE